MKKKDIMNENIQILEKHQTIPVDIIKLSKELGIRLFGNTEWADNISGAIAKDPDSESGYSIYVNINHHPNRQRFTIAHEIAHYIFHKEQIGDGIREDILFRSSLSNDLEKEANSWASEILMPDHLLKKEEEKDIEKLAKKFEVSTQAMAIKMGLASGIPYDYKR